MKKSLIDFINAGVWLGLSFLLMIGLGACIGLAVTCFKLGWSLGYFN